MPDRTLEVVLKLSAGEFTAKATEAAKSVARLGQAMSEAIRSGIDPLAARLAAATAAKKIYNEAMARGQVTARTEIEAAQAATQALIQMTRAQVGAGQAAQATAQASTQMAQAQAATAASAHKTTAQLADVYNALMGVKEGYQFVSGAVQGYLDIGAQAAQRDRTARMFANLSGSADAARANLNAMRQATRYTLSETAAMTQAVTLLGLKLAETPDELAQITQQVVALGGQFGGLSASSAIQAFALTLSNQSLDRVDAFGLSGSDVTAKVEQFTAAGMDAAQAFKAAFLEALDEKFQAVGGGAADAATAFEQYQAAVQDLSDVLGNTFLPYATRAAEALRDWATLASGGFTARGNLAVETGLQGAESPEAFAAKVSQAFGAALSVEGTLGLGPDLAGVRQAIINTATTQEEYNAGMAEYNRLLQENAPLTAAQAATQRALTGDWLGAADALFNYGKATTAGTLAQEDLGAAAEWAARQSQQAAQTAAQAAAEEAQQLAALEAAAVKLRTVEEQMAAKARDARIQAAQQAADAELRAAQRAEDQTIAAARRVEDQARSTAQRRAQIAAQYAAALEKAEQARSTALAQAEAARGKAIEQARVAHGKRLADIEATYQQRVADIQRQFSKSVAEAEIDRDAEALYRAQQTRDEQLAEATRDRSDQQQGAERDYSEQLTAAQQAYAEQQTAAQQAYAQQREAAQQAQTQALADLETSLAQERAAQALADARRYEDEQLARAREQEARTAWLQARLGQVTDEFDAEYQAALAHHNRMAILANAATRGQTLAPQGSSSGRTTRRGGRAGGGYADYGDYTLGEAGREFVLNAATTRRLEGVYGGNLTQQNIGSPVSISASFTGMGANDRAWFEARLGQFAQQIAGALG